MGRNICKTIIALFPVFFTINVNDIVTADIGCVQVTISYRHFCKPLNIIIE